MPKKYSTLRTRMREQVKAEKPKRKYQRREPGAIKEATRVTYDSFVKRHEYCVSLDDIRREIARAARKGLAFDIDENKIKAVCNHPEDGWCSHSPPTEEQLKEINEKLGGESQVDGNDLENPDKESKPRRRRGEKPPKQYFCLKCEKHHIEKDDLYDKHMAHKRGRGRPKK